MNTGHVLHVVEIGLHPHSSLQRTEQATFPEFNFSCGLPVENCLCVPVCFWHVACQIKVHVALYI